MDTKQSDHGPMMRLFQVRVKEGCADELLSLFATTSADVVCEEPGNVGYFFGKGVAVDDDRLVFASLWKDLESIKQRFGKDWQHSHLPDGYDDLIEECSVQHISLQEGWFVPQDQ